MTTEPTLRVEHGPWRMTVGADGAADARGDEGVAVHGRAVLARYRWRWWPADAAAPAGTSRVDDGALRTVETEPGGLRLERTVASEGAVLRDRLVFRNAGGERRALTLELAVAAPPAGAPPHLAGDAPGWTFVGRPIVRLRLDPLAAAHPDGADWELSLAPGEAVEVGATFELTYASAPAPGAR